MNIYSPILLLLRVCADAFRSVFGQGQRAVFEQRKKDETFEGTVNFFDQVDFVSALLYVCLCIFIFVLFRDYLSIEALSSFDASPGSQIAVVVQIVWWVALVGSVVWLLLLRVPRFRKRYDAVETLIGQRTRSYEIIDFLFVKNRSFGYLILLLLFITIAGGVVGIIGPSLENWVNTSITYFQEARPHDWKEALATWFFLFLICFTAIMVLGIFDSHKALIRILLFLGTSLLIAILTAIACRAAFEIFRATPLSIFFFSAIGIIDVTLCASALIKLGHSWDRTATMPTVQFDNNGTVATIIGLILGIMALKFWVAWILWLDDALVSFWGEFLWVETLVGPNAHITLIFPGALAGLGSSGLGMIQGNTSIWNHTGLTINPAVLAGVIIYTGFYWIGG